MSAIVHDVADGLERSGPIIGDDFIDQFDYQMCY